MSVNLRDLAGAFQVQQLLPWHGKPSKSTAVDAAAILASCRPKEACGPRIDVNMLAGCAVFAIMKHERQC